MLEHHVVDELVPELLPRPREILPAVDRVCRAAAVTIPLDTGHRGRHYVSIFDMSKPRTEVPYGALDLVILKTLDTLGAMHGYSIARRIEQVADNLLRMSQGSIYPALIRLEQQGWIRTQWGVSETNRRVKFYALTAAGTRQLRVEVDNWERATALVTRFLEAKP
jgi:transcriptional regulator